MRVIAIDLGGTWIRIGAMDREGRIDHTTVLPTADYQDPAAILGAIGDTAYESIRDKEDVAGVALAMPGLFAQDVNRPSLLSNLPFLQGVDVRGQLESRLELPTMLETDANAAALAEARLGAGQGSNRLLVVSAGTGIGVGVLLDGQLIRHTRGTAGSLGHVVIDPDGPECRCGGRGCVEALASGKAFIERLQYNPDEPGDRVWDEILTRMNGKDPNVTAAVETVGRALGVAVAGWLAIYQPDRVVLRGGLASLGPPWADAVERSMGEVGAPFHTESVSLRTGRLGDQAGMIGAALSYFDKMTT